jgi:hypothetical protein
VAESKLWLYGLIDPRDHVKNDEAAN